jgi:hypothetical protein
LVLCFSFNLVFCVLLLIGFLAFPKSALHTPTWRTNCGRESTVPPKWWVAREKAPPPSQEGGIWLFSQNLCAETWSSHWQ